MSTNEDPPKPPPDPAADKPAKEAREKTEREEKEDMLPAPLPEEQRKTAEEWQRPPGQNSG